jgi:hypothetical protein
MKDIALRIRQHLNLNVVDFGKELFDQDVIITESGQGLIARRHNRAVEIFRRPNHAHAFTSPSGAGFNENWITNGGCGGHQVGIAQACSIHTGHNRHASPLGQNAGRSLASHDSYGFRTRPNEDDVLLCAGSSEFCVLTQESIAWMNGIRAAYPCDLQQRWLIQICIGGCYAGQNITFISEPRPMCA